MKTKYLSKLLLPLLAGLSCAPLASAGPWVEVPGPAITFTQYIHSIAAVNDNDIWAVGSEYNSGSGVLLEHWDGSAWSTVPGVNPGPKGNFLLGVTALASNNVWAVGDIAVSGSIQQTLVEHWNGTHWRVVPSPNLVSRGANILAAISAVSSRDIWAVGYAITASSGLSPLALHWDGAAWSIASTPLVSDAGFYAVAAVSTNDVWAVGYSGATNQCGNDHQTLTMHWDGISWNLIPSPNVGTDGTFLTGVAALASNNVWAVGYSGCTIVDSQTVTLQWNGTVWNVIPSVNPSSIDSLAAIVAIPPKTLWAVGHDHQQGQPLTERWNGTAWSVVPVPPVVSDAHLDSVTVTPTRVVWALGKQNTDSDELFLMKAP